ncbi:MAG: hypothetical protein AMXMBFR33_71450 [Candidatus Xenobia bacterium]
MRIHAQTLPASLPALPARASGDSPDQVTISGHAPATNTMEAARKLFHTDTERARHIVHSFPIDDVRQRDNTYYYPPTPVFTPDGTLVVGTNKGTVLAFDPVTRQERWRRELPPSGYNTPVSTPDGRLLFSNQESSQVLCLRQDGSEVFQAELPGPLIQDIQLDSKGNAYALTRGQIVALDPQGQELWRQPAPEENAALLATPDDRMVLATAQGVTLLDDQGKELWSHPCVLTRCPAFTPDNTMFLATDEGVLVARPEGTIRAADPLPGKPYALLADARGNVVVVTDNGHVVSLDSQGKERCRRDMLTALPSAPAVLGDGTILLCTAESQVWKLDSDLQPESIMHLPRKSGWRTIGMNTPQVAPNGAIYVGQEGNRLDVLSKEGHVSWRLDGYHRSSPSFGPDGSLAVAHYDQVHLLKERSLDEVLAEPSTEQPVSAQVERRGDFLVIGGRMVRVKKPW